MPEMQHADSTPTPAAQEAHPHRGEWLRELVFGLNDGLVTTLVFVMAVAGIADNVIRIVIGEVIAGGLSMALGGYFSAATAVNIRDFRIATERHEIIHEPDEERAELRELYRRKGFRGPLLERIVDHLTANEERWLGAMLADEHGMVEERSRHPVVDGLVIGLSFMAGGVVPAIPFFLSVSHPQVWAYVATAVVALIFGSLKAQYTLKGPVRSGLEFLGIVTLGTLGGALVGLLLHSL
jgi:VIT1/CCC1 family predicted Fe2+/Mn2+ transporter